METTRKNWSVGLCALLVSALCACSNPEGKGQSLFETAQFEEQQMNFKHARLLYEEIIRDYPESSYASKAKERLAAIAGDPSQE